MATLLEVSKSFLEWAQSLPDVVIPAGLESDMREAIASSEAVEQCVESDERDSADFEPDPNPWILSHEEVEKLIAFHRSC